VTAVTGSSPFVGRRAELASLLGLLDVTRAEGGGLVFVAGEPGVGKTRLLDELARRAGDAGWLVLAGRAHEPDGMPPYVPFVEALRAYLRSQSAERLPSEVGITMPALALLLPEPRDRRPAVPTGPALPPTEERYRLFDGVADFLLAVARGTSPPGPDPPLARGGGECWSITVEGVSPSPRTARGGRRGERSGLLLLLDDLHWAETPSLLLLQHIADRVREAPLLIVVGYRDVGEVRSDGLAPLVADLLREERAALLRLGRLSPGETALLVKRLAGRAPAPAILDAIERRTQGNPFFVTHLVRHLISRGCDLSDPHGSAVAAGEMPPRLRLVIEGRLARLSAGANALLRVAAVLQGGFGFELLRAAGELDDAALLEALEEAIGAGMLVAEVEAFDFAHALIRETVYATLRPPHRQRLHLRAARAIELVHARTLDHQLPALAMHYRHAGPMVVEQAIEYARRAGEAAAAAFAWEEATGHWRAALELLGTAHDVESRRCRASLLERLGDVLYLIGADTSAAIRYLEEAAALYDAAGDGDRAAAVHALLGRNLALWTSTGTVDVPRALMHFRAAEAILRTAPADIPLGELYTGLATAALKRLEIDEGLAAADRARAIGAAMRSEPLIIAAMTLRGALLSLRGDLASGLTLLEQAWRNADRLDDPLLAYLPLVWRLKLDKNVVGDLQGGRRRIERELGQSRVTRLRGLRINLTVELCFCLVLAGDLAAAHRLAIEDSPSAESTLLLADGEWEAAARGWTAELERFRQAGDLFHLWTTDWWLAWLYRVQGKPMLAEACLRDALASAPGTLATVDMVIRPPLALLLAELGRADEADAQLGRCRTILHGGEDWGAAAGQVALAEAAVAASGPSPEAADASIGQALAVFQARGLPWDEAEAWRQWARLLASRRHPGADEKLAAARAIYRRIGAGRPWLDRLESSVAEGSALRPGERPSSNGRRPPDGLTRRETEVLRLIAAGKTNREIAADLVLSVRTVELHISSIYAKIGVGGPAARVAASGYAMRHGLAAGSLPVENSGS
jgi:DNA-binding CsgD family transcriptional regulator/tetratricopeptide (TPR) repeat protein